MVRISSALVVALALAAPCTAWAAFTVGLLWNSLPQSHLDAGTTAHPGPKAIENGLRQLGWTPGRDVRLVSRSAEGRYDRMPALVDSLVRLPVDVLVVFGPEAARAAQERTATIPIVWAGSHAMNATGAPRGNVTGITYLGGTPGLKRLELLKTLAPRIKRVAIFVQQTGLKDTAAPSESQVRAAAQMGLETRVFHFEDEGAAAAAFEAAREWRADAAYMSVFPTLTWSHPVQRRILDLSRTHRLPTVYEMPSLAQAGALIAYGHDDLVGQGRAAYYIDRLLRGAKPSELPIEQVSTVQLSINRATARELGLQIPASLLVAANSVFD